MEDYFEDEDVTPEYSPLNQYLSSLNLTDKECDVFKSCKRTKKISLSISKCLLDDGIFSYHYILKRKIFGWHIFFILREVLKINVLNEFDENYVHYLIQSRNVHWKCITNNISLNKPNFIKLFGLSLIFQIIYVIFGGWTMVISVLISLVAYILSLIVCGFLLRGIISVFFTNLVTISNQSRQIILLVQEILSLNQGYSKIVHLTDNSLYDCSKSFNEEFLENFTKQIFSILFVLHSHMENINKIFSKRVKETESVIEEFPWIEDNFETFEFDIKNLNFRQPMSQLKNLHNLIQSQFAELIKFIVLLTYFVNNHPDLFLMTDLLKLLYRFRVVYRQLLKCKDLLQIKTKSNLSNSINQEKEFIISSDNKFKTLCNVLNRLELHLFEISEFSIQLSNRIKKYDNLTQSLLNEKLDSQLQMLGKSKMHFDGIQNCWKLLNEELNEMLKKNDQNCNRTTIKYLNEIKPVEQVDDINDPIIINTYPEIVDEVIEGIPEEIENRTETNVINQDIDTFEERYSTNAKALLNELQSVINIRAQDWKKREKLALKRRAAEGKFVFNKEFKFNINLDDVECKCQNETIDRTIESVPGNTESVLDFRKSLGEMILKQRHTMKLDSLTNGKAEECFED